MAIEECSRSNMNPVGNLLNRPGHTLSLSPSFHQFLLFLLSFFSRQECSLRGITYANYCVLIIQLSVQHFMLMSKTPLPPPENVHLICILSAWRHAVNAINRIITSINAYHSHQVSTVSTNHRRKTGALCKWGGGRGRGPAAIGHALRAPYKPRHWSTPPLFLPPFVPLYLYFNGRASQHFFFFFLYFLIN